MIYRENERLYLRSWAYNAARILTALDCLVVERGGRVKQYYTAIISNCSLTSAAHETEEMIAKIESLPLNETRAKALSHYKQELHELKTIPNEPIAVKHLTSIKFVLGDCYYLYELDDNPFFNPFYIKTPVKNGTYSADVVGETVPADWLDDCYLKWNCSYSDIQSAANKILAMLLSARPSVIQHEFERKCVPNIYNDGYHYKKVLKRECFKKIDF